MKSPVIASRLRLTALWLAVFARAVGENAVRAYAVLRSSNGEHEHSVVFLFVWLGMAAVPAFALAPLIGALASSRRRSTIMSVATLAGLSIIAWSSFQEQRTGSAFWLDCMIVLALESAFFGACRFSLLPEAVRAAHISLPQTIGLFAIATAAGIGIGIWSGVTQFAPGQPGLPVPLQVGLIGYGLALIAVLAARFPVQQPVRVSDGLIKPLLKTAGAIFQYRYGRNSLLALWGLFAIGLAVNQGLYPPREQPTFFLFLVVGLVIGSLHANAFRALGLVPYAAIGLAGGAIWAGATGNWFEPGLAMALFIGILWPPLLTTFAIYQPEATRGHGGALLQAGWSLLTGLFLVLLVMFMADQPVWRAIVGKLVIGLSVGGMLFAWLVFFRPTFEFTWEIILWPIYRIKAIGPETSQLPWRGPLLIIANHSAWFDPIWLDKVLPLPTKPIMTSRFYDLPMLSWIFRRVIGAIRVPDVKARKEAPELAEAIAALDRGECVVLFPEGWLRRRDDQPLRRFGRGIWLILTARPETPVLPCWIEGGWGSMFSHKNGPPLQNHQFDFWRPIRIGMLAPRRIDAAVLKTHIATRLHLMQTVVEARALLGLPPIDPFKLPVHDEADDHAADEPKEKEA